MRLERLTAVITCVCACLVATLAACNLPSDEEPESLEVENVGVGATAAMTPEGDETEKSAGPTLSGGLPPAFPSDLPIFVPASVSDFSSPEDEVRYVLLHAEAPLEQVRRSLSASLDRSPWRRVGDDPWRRSKGHRSARYLLEADEVSGTIVKIEY